MKKGKVYRTSRSVIMVIRDSEYVFLDTPHMILPLPPDIMLTEATPLWQVLNSEIIERVKKIYDL